MTREEELLMIMSELDSKSKNYILDIAKALRKGEEAKSSSLKEDKRPNLAS